MPYKFTVTPSALLDLQLGIEYYDRQEFGLGRKFEAHINLFFEKINEFPLSASFAYDNVRFKVVNNFPYIIFYAVSEDKVQILRVFNTYQKPFK